MADSAAITVGSGAPVQNQATGSAGFYGFGADTIDMRSNGTLRIEAGANVFGSGSQGNAETISFVGGGNTIDNSGAIQANTALAFFNDTTSRAAFYCQRVGRQRDH